MEHVDAVWYVVAMYFMSHSVSCSSVVQFGPGLASAATMSLHGETFARERTNLMHSRKVSRSRVYGKLHMDQERAMGLPISSEKYAGS